MDAVPPQSGWDCGRRCLFVGYVHISLFLWGTKFDMTKKLLLSAAAVAAMAFAGAASAGQLTTGSQIGSESIIAGSKVAPYVVAKDFALAEAGIVTNNATNNLDRTQFAFLNDTNPNAVAVNTDYVVTLTLSGPAVFKDQGQTVVTLGGNPTTVTPIRSGDGKTLTIYAKTGGTVTALSSLADVKASGFNIEVSGQAAVSVAYKLQQVVGSQTLDLDSSSAQEVIQFKNALTVYNVGAATNAKASLPNFDEFDGNPTLASATFTSAAVSDYFVNLQGESVPAVAAIITGYTATITGPQVSALLTSFGGTNTKTGEVANAPAVTDLTAGSVKFTKATGGGDSFSALLTAVEDLPIEAGSYNASVKPIYAEGWSGPTTVEKTLFNISLDGTNFYAPWFALQAPGANSTLRLANNGSTAIGPIVISLKANNGSAAPTGTYTINSIAAGSFTPVTGTQLKAAFGTDAANGDLMVTIQSKSENVSAKVRTTQNTGQIFENSLDILRAPSSTEDQVKALEAKVDAVQDTLINW